MMNYQYDALAASVRLKDKTSSSENRALLHRIKNNDPALTYLCIHGFQDDEEEEYGENNFQVRDGEDLGWLGYFIGENETLKSLYVCSLPTCKDQIRTLFTRIQRNK